LNFNNVQEPIFFNGSNNLTLSYDDSLKVQEGILSVNDDFGYSNFLDPLEEYSISQVVDSTGFPVSTVLDFFNVPFE
jgi:hypothetical protein